MEAATAEKDGGMSRKMKVLLALGLYFLITIALALIAGSSGKNEEFQPQNEFLLDPWISLDPGFADMSINKAVLYLFLAAAATIAVMT
jgi:F-type H+-transporting ATPase subunit a